MERMLQQRPQRKHQEEEHHNPYRNHIQHFLVLAGIVCIQFFCSHNTGKCGLETMSKS